MDSQGLLLSLDSVGAYCDRRICVCISFYLPSLCPWKTLRRYSLLAWSQLGHSRAVADDARRAIFEVRIGIRWSCTSRFSIYSHLLYSGLFTIFDFVGDTIACEAQMATESARHDCGASGKHRARRRDKLQVGICIMTTQQKKNPEYTQYEVYHEYLRLLHRAQYRDSK